MLELFALSYVVLTKPLPRAYATYNNRGAGEPWLPAHQLHKLDVHHAGRGAKRGCDLR